MAAQSAVAAAIEADGSPHRSVYGLGRVWVVNLLRHNMSGMLGSLLVSPTMSRYVPGGRKEQLLLHQVHAYQHFLARIGKGPACTGSFPAVDAITGFVCPLCATFVPPAEWTEDHAPTKGGKLPMGRRPPAS